jgi:O-antigen/teichoic acid export membrane protein
MIVATGTVTPVVWLCNLLLARGAHGPIEVARFGAAYNWFAVVSAVPAVLAQVEFVRMARSRATGDVKGLARGYRLFTLQNFAFVAPIVAIGIAAAGPMGDLFRLDGPSTRNCIRVLLASALVASLGNPAGMFLAVIDRIWIASLLNIGWACIVLTLGWILRQSGASGIAVAFLIAYSTHFVVATTIAWRMLARPGSIRPAEV